MTIKKITLIIGVIGLVGAVCWSIYRGPLWNRGLDNSVPPPIVTDNPKGEAKINSPAITYGYAATSSTRTGGKINDVTPSLSRSIVIPASFSPETAALAKILIEKLIGALKKSPENAGLWAELGMERKGIEDYEGAKEAYTYAFTLQPNNAVLADNLGVIYGDYLKEYGKAEQYYRLALKLDPKTSYRYLRLFEFYSYVLKDKAKAKAILEEGLRAIPGDASLTTLLETLN